MTEQPSQHDDKVAALHSLAEGGPDQPQEKSQDAAEGEVSDALAASAGGQNDAPAGEPNDPQAAQGAANLAGLPVGGKSFAASKARAAALGRQAAQAHAHQFKRIMIPLLITVGLLLFVLGGVVAGYVWRGNSAETELSRQGVMAKWAVVAAFPLGAILLLAAMLFHRELKRWDKSQAGNLRKSQPNRPKRTA